MKTMRMILTAMVTVLVLLAPSAHAAYLTGDPCVGKTTLAAQEEIVVAAQVAGSATGPVPAAVLACPERSFGWQERANGREVGLEASGDSGPGAGAD